MDTIEKFCGNNGISVKKNGLCSKLHRAEKTLILYSLTVFYTDIIYIESTEGLRRKTNV